MRTTKSGNSTVATPDNKWNEVLAAAIDVFDEKGYKAATVQDIADEAGIVKGTLYYYIKAKEDLLFEVMDHVQKQLFPKLDELAAAEGTYAEKLHAFVRGYVLHTIENRKAVGIFLREFNSLSTRRRKKVTEVRDVYDQFVHDLLVAGRDAGEFDSTIDLHVATYSIFGMVNWLYQWYRPGGPLTPEEIASTMATCAVNAVRAPSAAHLDGVALPQARSRTRRNLTPEASRDGG
jgi:AcrR family transcriptional regulator